MRLVDLAPVIAATWPPAAVRTIGPFTVPTGAGGGQRVSAARLTDPDATDASEAEIDAALAAQADQGQAPLVMVQDHQTALDVRLSARRFAIRDTTHAMIAPTATLAAHPPPVTCFATWPPLAIQTEIWAAAGVGPGRLAVMDRATGRKMSFFGRVDDKPAGTAFVAIHDGIAMLHALEIAPAQRRKGLGQIMMRAAADWAQAEGAARFAILVTGENQPALGLYASLGFEAVGTYHYRSPQA
ncbi:GNAT family N-acetyltransferase [Roseicyclus mahoneyensis]|uniref:Ribosomal protein S18 acetylase RimI-like enzyme n=1 Tax=Roseicyclus mahoneyensis TaxID=164332 RepID=A0A316H2R7_9RHOB|nr:GNAT family N-acetyltransferase [Roseicyclus mahoneyensis]PWK61661.1 ribosomal protein S18 acetylase RimI-like enzyme [Roseicyclus mahoneyensis]